MLTEKNFSAALKAMNFVECGNIFEKTFADGVTMKADLNAKKLFYPAQIQGRDRNDSYDKSRRENLVVFECVNRLLDKGYNPEHIELERQWQLGHSPKGGRADICVSSGGKVLFIVECKTFGDEFNHEIDNMRADGGQLFSYWQQEQSCRWLMLYASDFDDGKWKFSAASISCNENIYRDAHTVPERFKIWSERCDKKFLGDVIFHDETVAYKIGVKPLRKRDLKSFEDAKLVNQFEEILRHNQVSNKETAFNRLVALFICKLVDETLTPDDAEVSFQFKDGTDTQETFQDRLQGLYAVGMEKFMHDPIAYVSLREFDDLLFQYGKQRREELGNAVREKFRRQKFFTNNEFAFLDVHNEKLFYLNAKILREVVDMLKDFRIIGATKLQTLGNMFERLLNKGFRQDAGQFFTPTPIAQFIWDSLPLDEIVARLKEPPKVIDYACGAGHFLTEGFKAVNDCFARNNLTLPLLWEGNKLFGVEKDPRLATVSKVSLFMHGAGEGKIKFGDGLENYPDENISPATFDVLVANPPYSVSGFKAHIKLVNEFDVLDKISNSGSEIETLFVERISQLVKPKGVAAVILPDSILNKKDKSFVAARESLLKNFYVRAIVQLDSKTFGATGTKTVTLFLQKIFDPPEKARLFKDSAEIILRNEIVSGDIEEEIFAAYTKKIGVAPDDYRKFITRAVDFDNRDVPYFAGYADKFKPVTAKNLSDDERRERNNQKFYDEVIAAEREKIIYFALTFRQTTLIVTAPDDNKEQEAFLGYEWSNRRGNEGLDDINRGGLLFDNKNRVAENKIAAVIRAAFRGERVDLPALKKYFRYATLSDMLDFDAVKFTKTITLSELTTKDLTTDRNFPTVKLGDVVDINSAAVDPTKTPEKIFHYVDIGSVDAATNKIDFSNVVTGAAAPSRARRLANDGDILISTVRPYLKSFAQIVNAPQDTLYSTGFAVLSTKNPAVISNEFIFCLFMNDTLLMAQMKAKMSKGSYPSINQDDLKNFHLLLPPVDVQKKIVDDFKALDAQIDSCEQTIQSLDADVQKKFNALFADLTEQVEIGQCCEIEKGANLTREQAVAGAVPVVAGGILPSCYHNLANRPANIISVSASGKNAGYVNFWRVPIFATDCNTLRAKNHFSTEYIYHALKNIQDDIYRLQRGSAQPHVYGNDIAKLKIPNAPLELQKEFASYVSTCESMKQSARERRDELIHARGELVTKYFR